MEETTSSRRGLAWLAPALVLGGIWRFWYALAAHRPIDFDYSDMHGYISVARRIADPQTVTNIYDWYYPRGTAAVLAVFIRLFGEDGWRWAAGLQALLGTVEIGLVYLLARRLFSERVGLLAAWGLALHYLAVSYAGFFMSENYLAFTLIAGFALLAAASPGRCAAAGVVLGLAAWVKPQAFVAVLLMAAWMVYPQRRFRSAAALLAGGLLVVVPASILTSQVVGRPTFISLNGGQTFALSQCPFRSIHFKVPNYEMGFGLPTVYQRAARGEAESRWIEAQYNVAFTDNAFYMHEGVKCIAADPWGTVRLAALHLADILAGPFWSPVGPWPEASTVWSRWAIVSNGYLAYCVAPLAALGMWLSRRRHDAQLLFLSSVGAVVVSALIFHGDPRFRAPYDFVLFVGAAVTLDRALLWLRARAVARSSRPPNPLPVQSAAN